MKINRDNYEAYFLDYHEGRLSPEMAEEVLLFVELNPEFINLFTGFESVNLIADPDIVFENKSLLKKNQVFATSLVNDSNYEEFLIGETEGILDAGQLAALEEFISINPQFEKDRSLYALAHIPADEIVFEAKESLKQKAIPVGEITALSFETYMARELEGDLNAEEEHQFAEFMKFNPHLEKDHGLYKHTVLSPDTEIVFADKGRLKHSVTPVRRLVYYALSAAASLALVMSVYFLLNRNDIPKSLAIKDNVKQKTEQTVENPASVIPGNQVAVTDQPKAKRSKNKAITVNNSALPDNSTKVSGPESEPLALTERKPIGLMQSRAAGEITNRDFVDPEFTFIRVSRMYSNQHLEFYYNLKMAEEIQYAEMNSKDKNPAKTILNAAGEKAGNLFAWRKPTPAREENKGFSMWTLAELGVQTLNTVTSSEMELKLTKDDEGKVVGYNLESGLLDIEKDLKK